MKSIMSNLQEEKETISAEMSRILASKNHLLTELEEVHFACSERTQIMKPVV